jgi:hypothetical protein
MFKTTSDFATITCATEYLYNEVLNRFCSWSSALKYLTVSKLSKESVAL